MALPNTAIAQELFNAYAADGGAGWDHSALVKTLKLMAAHPVAEDETISAPRQQPAHLSRTAW